MFDINLAVRRLCGTVEQATAKASRNTSEEQPQSCHCRNAFSMHFPFLSLPRELRDQIYKHLLVVPDPIHPIFKCLLVHSDSERGHQAERETNLSLPVLTTSLLCVSQQIHDEGATIFYAHNIFALGETKRKQLSTFFDRIGPRNAARVRHVYLDTYSFWTLAMRELDLESSAAIFHEVRNRCENLVTLSVCLGVLELVGSMAEEDRGRDWYPEDRDLVLQPLVFIDKIFRAEKPPVDIIGVVQPVAPDGIVREEARRLGRVLISSSPSNQEAIF